MIDGNNVIGATAAGWWRDPALAVLRLVDRLRCFARTIEEPVIVVFDVPHPGIPEGLNDGIVVHYATRRGRDAADDRIVELLDEGGTTGVEVVTSDRTLADRVRRRGAHATGAGRFLARLDAAGC